MNNLQTGYQKTATLNYLKNIVMDIKYMVCTTAIILRE